MTLNKLNLNKLTLNKVSAIIIGLVLTLVIQADLVKEDKGKKATFLKALTTLPITVNKTKTIQASFSSLNKQGISAGLNNIVINGTLSYKKAGNYQKVFIQWHSVENNLKKPNLINKAEFSKKPRSELTTDEQQIAAPQDLTVEVDEQSFMAAVNRLNKGRLAQVETLTAKTNTNSNSNPKSNRAALNTNRGRGSLSSNNGVKSQLPTLGDVADAGSNATEQCEYRYDLETMRAHEQQRTNQVNSTGVVTNQGACLDSGVSYELNKTYGAPCSSLVSNDKVYQSYRITGVVAGEDKIIRDCQADLVENTIPVQATTDQCNYEHHLDLGLSYQTQRQFYELNGEMINISQCESNERAFLHQEAVCSYDLEVSHGFAVPQTKLYITLDDGTASMVRNCTAHSTQISLIKKDCTSTNRYAHDFNASTSYLQQETWIENPFNHNQEVKLNACQISETTYPHLQQASHCARSFEDHNLLTRQAVRTYIDDHTQTPSEVFISECSNGYSDIPYTIGDVTLSNDGNTKTRNYTRGDGTYYQTTESTESKTFVYSEDNSGTHTWTIPDGVTSIYATLTSGQGGGAGGGGEGGEWHNAPNGNGSPGGISKFGSIVTDKGAYGERAVYATPTSVQVGRYSSKTEYLTVTPAQTMSVIVGAGGTGGHGSDGDGRGHRWYCASNNGGASGGGSGGHGKIAGDSWVSGGAGGQTPGAPGDHSGSPGPCGGGGAGGAHGSVTVKY